MKKFKLLSMSFILSILAVAWLNENIYAAEYEINDWYFTETTNVISDNRSNIEIDNNNNYWYWVMFVGPWITHSTPVELQRWTNNSIFCNKQLNWYFTINFTNFLMLPLNTWIIHNIGSSLYGDVSVDTGWLFYDCTKNGTKYNWVYWYIKWTYGNNTHEIRAWLNSNNNWLTTSPLQLAYAEDYPNTYRTLSWSVFDSLISGDVKILPKSIWIVWIDNYQSIWGTINNPIYYVDNSTWMRIYTKFSVKDNAKNIRLMLTWYDTNWQQQTIPTYALANPSILGSILSWITNTQINYSNWNSATTTNIAITNKDYGMFWYNPISYEKMNNIASWTITLEIWNNRTQTITFMVSGVNCEESVTVTPSWCYAWNKTATISCYTWNLNKTEKYNWDNQGRTTTNTKEISWNWTHNVKVKDWLGNEKTYSFEVTWINNSGIQAPTNLSATPATWNNRQPKLSWNSATDEWCNNWWTLHYWVKVCGDPSCNTITKQTNNITNTYWNVSTLDSTQWQKYYRKVWAYYDENSISWSEISSFYLDTTAPTIAITNPTTSCTTNKTISATFTDSWAWINSKEWVIKTNSGCNSSTSNFSSYTGAITLSENDSGKYVCFRSVDKAWNTWYKVSNQITKIDTSWPIWSIEPIWWFDSWYMMRYSWNIVKLQLTANDVWCNSVSKMQFSCDWTNWSTAENFSGTKNFNLTNYINYGCTTDEWQKTIYVKYIDNIGNTWNTYSTNNIKIDKTAPTCEITKTNDCQNWNVLININAIDNWIWLSYISDTGLSFSEPGTQYSTVKDYLWNTRQCTGTANTNDFGSGSSVTTNISWIPNGRTWNNITITFSTTVNNSCSWGNSNISTTTYYCSYDSWWDCTPNIQLPWNSLSITCAEWIECRKYIKYYSVGYGISPEEPKTSNAILIDHKKPTCNYSYVPQQWTCTSWTVTATISGSDSWAWLSSSTPSPQSTWFTSNWSRSYTFIDNVWNSQTCTAVVSSIDKIWWVWSVTLKNQFLTWWKSYYSGSNITLQLSVNPDSSCSKTKNMIFSCNWTVWSNPVAYTSSYADSPYYNFNLTSYTSYGCTTNDWEKTIHVKYIDELGNIGDDNSVTLYIDQTAPACDSENIVYTPSWCTSGTVTGNVSSAANDTWVWLATSTPITPTSISFTTNTTKYYTVKDKLWNTWQCPATVNRINTWTANWSITTIWWVDVPEKGKSFSWNITLQLNATSAWCSSAVNKMRFKCLATANWSTLENFSWTKIFNLANYQGNGCTPLAWVKTIYVQYLVDNTPQRSGSTQIYFDNVAPNNCNIDYDPDENVICTQWNVNATLSTDDDWVWIDGSSTITTWFTSNWSRSYTFKDKVWNSRTCTANVTRINTNSQTITWHINISWWIYIPWKWKSFSGLSFTLLLDASSNWWCANPVSWMQFRCNTSSNWSDAEIFSGTKIFNLANYTSNGCTTNDWSKTIYVKYTFTNGSSITNNTWVYIDRTKPTCNTPTYNPSENNGCTPWPVNATLSATDNWVWMANPNSITTWFTSNWSRSYTFKDKVWNSRQCSVEVNRIYTGWNNNGLSTEIHGVPDDWTWSDVNITFTVNTSNACNSANDNAPTKTYHCTYNKWSSPCTPTTLGTGFTITCDSGSVCEKYVVYYSIISWTNIEEIPYKTSSLIQIDKKKPTCDGVDYIAPTCTNLNVTATFNVNDLWAWLSDNTIFNTTFTTNTTQNIAFYDKVWNNNTCSATVNWIDTRWPNQSWNLILTWWKLINNKYYYSGTTIKLQLNAIDSGCSEGIWIKVRFSCDWTKFSSRQNYTTTYTLNLGNYSAQGCSTNDWDKTIYVQYRDNLWNIGTKVSTGFAIDKTPPQCWNINFSTEQCTNNNVTATLYASDALVGLDDSSTSSPQTLTFQRNWTQTYTFKDKLWNSKQCSATVNWIDKDAPNPITFEDTETPECVGINWTAEARDDWCAWLNTRNAFYFHKQSFGNNLRGPNILSINANSVKNPTTEKIPQTLTVRDTLWNQDTKKASLRVIDTQPTLWIRELFYNNEYTPISGETLLFENLIKEMKAEDWACWPDTMSIIEIKCDDWEFTKLDPYWISVIPPKDNVWSVSCTITFVDDENNEVQGTIIYYYDTLKPICSRWDPSNQCIPWWWEWTIELMCSDKKWRIYINNYITKNIKYNSDVLELENIDDWNRIDIDTYDQYIYKLTYIGNRIKTGNTSFTLLADTIFDLAYNWNEEITSMPPVEVDNAWPTFTVRNVSVPECSTWTLTITNVKQVGCASANGLPYSWDWGRTYSNRATYPLYNNSVWSRQIVTRVRDSFWNYTQKTGIVTWTDVPLTANNFTVHETCGEKTVNWIQLSNATAWSCEQIMARVTQNWRIGICKIKNEKLAYIPNENVQWDDTCILEITDGDTKKTITVTRLEIDSVSPTITMESEAADGCRKGGKEFKVTWTWNETVKWFDIKNITAKIWEIGKEFTFEKNPTYEWLVISPEKEYWETIVSVLPWTVTDNCGNENKEWKPIKWEYDNVGPEYDVLIEPGYECSDITANIKEYKQIGCAKDHETPYSRNWWKEYTDKPSNTLSNQNVWTQTINVRVQDALENYTEQEITYIWEDVQLEANNSIEYNNIWNQTASFDRKELSNAHAWSCETINATISRQWSKWHCELDPNRNNILIYTPNNNVVWEDQCVLTITDWDTQKQLYVNLHDIDTINPTITIMNNRALENEELLIQMTIGDIWTWLKDYKCWNNERISWITGQESYTCSMWIELEPKTWKTNVQARDKWWNITQIEVNYEWTNVTPTAKNIRNETDEWNPLILTADGTDPGGTQFKYQWYSDQTCYTKINNETGITYTAPLQPEPTGIIYYYKVIDAQWLESNCASATAKWRNVAPTAHDVSNSGIEWNPIILTASWSDPAWTEFKWYQWYLDANCTNAIPRETRNTYRVPAQWEPTTQKYYYTLKDKQWLKSNCATATAIWTNVIPLWELSNDGPKPECTPITYRMTWQDAGWWNLTYLLYEWTSCKWSTIWSSSNIPSGTRKTWNKTLNKQWTYDISLLVQDANNTPSQCVSSKWTWNDTKPSFKWENTANIWNITWWHITNPFVTQDLIELMQPIDGACGTEPMTIIEVRCDENIIGKSNINNNTVTLTPKADIEKDSSCAVIFKDDENNQLTGKITFHVDTLNPTITIDSQGSGSCEKWGINRNIEWNRTEKVLGFDIRGISTDNWVIDNFNGKYNPRFTWTVTSPSTAGQYGTSTVIVRDHVATDELWNPNIQPSNELKWNYDNASPEITFNDIETPECVGIDWTAKANDIWCAWIDEKTAFLFSNVFGNNEWWNNTLQIANEQIPSAWTWEQILIVKDTIWNESNISAKLIATDTEPSFKWERTVNIWNITWIHLKEWFVTPDLIELMKPIDGACGTKPMTLINVKCDEKEIQNADIKENRIILTPREDIEIDSSCTVIFQDDEKNELIGTITFHIDTLNPIITLTSDGVNSCQKWWKARNVVWTRREKVLGFEANDITIWNWVIGWFTNNNPKFTWTVTSPSTAGEYGTTTIVVWDNVATDLLWNPNIQPSNELKWNYDNACPTITFNDLSVNECTATTWSASATDNGCAGISWNTAYKFSSTSFGNNTRWNASLSITKTQVPTAWTKQQIVTVRDILWNSCDKTATLTIVDTKPLFSWNWNVVVWNITWVHINTPFVTQDLIELMQPIDGACGTEPMLLINISCDNTITNYVIENNTAKLTPKTNIEATGSCTVTFKDDENNQLTGTITFYVDTFNPTVALTSEGSGSCQKWWKARNVVWTRREKVLGFEANDITIWHWVIGWFTNNNPRFTWTVTSPSTAGDYGTTTIVVWDNVATDELWNPNIQPSNELKWNYDNAAPNKTNINLDKSDSCLKDFSINITANETNDIWCNQKVVYQFCKSTTNNINDCNWENLSSRKKGLEHKFNNLRPDTTYYFFVRVKDELDNTSEWSQAYWTIESLSARNFTWYFNAKKEDEGPFTVTANRKRKSYASAWICENITAEIISCNGWKWEINDDILTFRSNAETWTDLHEQTQRNELYCTIMITDNNTQVEVTSAFQIKFDEIYLEPLIITWNSFVNYNWLISGLWDRTYKYTNDEWITLQINGWFISKDPGRHRYRVSCNGKDWPKDWEQYPNDYNWWIFNLWLINGIQGINGLEIWCDATEWNRQVYVELCDSPSKVLCNEYSNNQ